MNTVTHTLSRKTVQTTLLGLLLIMGAVDLARAATARLPEAGEFEYYDSNHDGLVSISEALALGMLVKAFEMADANHDGNLNPDEFVKAEYVDDHFKVTSFVDDGVLTAKVKSGLLKNAVVHALQVHIEVRNGVVQLTGYVAASNKQLAIAQIATAGEIAAGVEGVSKVINNLLIKS